jgi:hypothetical protein
MGRLIINGLRIDPIIFSVCAHELHQHSFETIGNVHNEPVLVAGDVEDNSAIADKVHCAPKVSLDVGRAIPIGVADIGKPSLEGTTRLRMTMPEGPQRGLRNDIHAK